MLNMVCQSVLLGCLLFCIYIIATVYNLPKVHTEDRPICHPVTANTTTVFTRSNKFDYMTNINISRPIFYKSDQRFPEFIH